MYTFTNKNLYMCFSKKISILSHITIHKSLFFHCQTQKTMNTWNISGTSIVLWKIHNRDQNIQNQKLITVVICRLVHLLPDWLFPCNTMTLQKYFWSSCSLAPKKSQLGQNWTLPWPVRGACREHPLTHCFRDFERKKMQERTPWD